MGWNVSKWIKVKNITIETGNLNRTNDILNVTHTVDTTGIKYVGYVEDNAKNFIRCETSFKRDVTNPVCALTTAGTMGTNNWYRSASVKTSFSQNTDATSGVREYGIGSYTGSKEITNSDNTGGITYTGYIKDVAGNTSSCSISYKKDSIPPVCTLTTTGTMGNNGWYKSATVDVSFSSNTDDLSGVNAYGLSSFTGNKTATQTANTTSVTYTGHIQDKAGNTNTCSVTFKKDDASEAQNGGCSATGNTTWKDVESITITHKLNVKPISGCAAGSSVFHTDTSTCSHSYNVIVPNGTAISTRQTDSSPNYYANSGAVITCPKYTENIYVDRENPSCGKVTYGNDSTSGVTISIACSDGGSGCTSSSYSGGTKKTSGSVTIEDALGHTNSCPYTVTSYKQYKTRTYDDCKYGN